MRYEFEHRHHRPARQRLHPRGRAGDRGGDPDGIERAGEPPVRTGARRRDPLRHGGSRRGRGPPDRGPPPARGFPPREPHRRPLGGRGRADGAGQRALGRARPGAGRARHAAELRRRGRPARRPGQPPDRGDHRADRGGARESRHRGRRGRGRHAARDHRRLRGAAGRSGILQHRLHPGPRQPRRGARRGPQAEPLSRGACRADAAPSARSIPAARRSRASRRCSCCSAGAS